MADAAVGAAGGVASGLPSAGGVAALLGGSAAPYSGSAVSAGLRRVSAAGRAVRGAAAGGVWSGATAPPLVAFELTVGSA